MKSLPTTIFAHFPSCLACFNIGQYFLRIAFISVGNCSDTPALDSARLNATLLTSSLCLKGMNFTTINAGIMLPSVSLLAFHILCTHLKLIGDVTFMSSFINFERMGSVSTFSSVLYLSSSFTP